MLITIKHESYNGAYKGICKASAINSIINYPMNTTEILIQNALFEKYNVMLKDICIKILKVCQYSSSEEGLTFYIPDKKLEEIARFITYGNGRVLGSKILIDAIK